VLLARLMGPARLLAAVASSLEDGSSALVVSAGELPEQFLDALEPSLDRLGLPLLRHGPATPTRVLARTPAVAGPAAWASACLEEQGLASGVHAIETADSAGWKSWRDFLREFCEAARSCPQPVWRRPRLCFLAQAGSATDTAAAGLVRLNWDDAIRPSDLLGLIEELDQPDVGWPVLRRLRQEVILRAARRDLGVAADLCRHPWRDLVDGLGFPGHSAEQARRIAWQAQVSVLFPWIEAIRAGLVASYGGRLRAPWQDLDATIDRIQDLELKHLRQQALSVLRDRALHFDLQPLIGLRNQIAHLHPVGHAALATLPERWLRQAYDPGVG
jgi:hypothetical protein